MQYKFLISIADLICSDISWGIWIHFNVIRIYQQNKSKILQKAFTFVFYTELAWVMSSDS